MAIPLPRSAIMEIRATPWALPYSLSETPAGTALTDHNRDALSVDTERIENSKRMANGTLRKIVIADKRKWSVNWRDLPDNTAYTVDGKLGARAIEQLWQVNAGAVGLQINDGAVTERVNVVISSFKKSISKRLGNINLWDVSLELEEI